jgi:autotransporter-associated beta strand protein
MPPCCLGVSRSNYACHGRLLCALALILLPGSRVCQRRLNRHPSQAGTVCGLPRVLAFMLVFFFIHTGGTVLGANKTWNGGASDNNWSSGGLFGNWGTLVAAPTAGDSLSFAGGTRTTPNNDIAADTSFAGIAFNSGAAAFTIGGNRITLGGNVTNNSTSVQTINLAMILSADRTFTTSASGGDLTIGGVLSETGGARGIIKAGTGTLTLSGANTYSGATTVSAGTLKIDNSGTTTARLANTSGVTVNSGGTLLLASSSGSSTDRISNSAGVTLNGGATFNTGGLSEGTRPSSSGSSDGAAGMGALTLTSTSSGSHAIIDFTNANGSSLVFSSLSGASGAFVDIKNWTGLARTDNGATTNDRLLFASDPGLTATQLANWQFFDDSGTAFATGAMEIAYGNLFEICPVPEPGTWFAGFMALAALGYQQRRRLLAVLRRNSK